MIWNDEFETLPREAMEALQLKRLRDLADRIAATVPFYRRKLADAGYRPGDIRKREDLARLPFTTKEDLRDNYPFGLFAVPMERVVRIHASSGTTGKPTVVGYTRRDIDTWSELMARTLSCGGTTSGDIVHNAYGYGLFTGGLGAHYGAEKIGAAVIPMSGGNTKRQSERITVRGYAFCQPLGKSERKPFCQSVSESLGFTISDTERLPE